jgi:hypothetical protein
VNNAWPGSHFVVDLQHVDVLSGGAPEIVVKIMERHTALDVALNEVSKLDRTRVVLITLDRGKPQASRELLLARKSVREALDPKDKAPLAGFARPKDLGKSSDYEMKVAWGLPNEIRLSKASGDAKPRDEGTITLFP